MTNYGTYQHQPSLLMTFRVFEGLHGGVQYYLQQVRKFGVQKLLTGSFLRYSYAANMLEARTDIRVIQELLGDKSSKTIENCTHVSWQVKQQISNPFEIKTTKHSVIHPNLVDKQTFVVDIKELWAMQ